MKKNIALTKFSNEITNAIKNDLIDPKFLMDSIEHFETKYFSNESSYKLNSLITHILEVYASESDNLKFCIVSDLKTEYGHYSIDVLFVQEL